MLDEPLADPIGWNWGNSSKSLKFKINFPLRKVLNQEQTRKKPQKPLISALFVFTRQLFLSKEWEDVSFFDIFEGSLTF